jgi:hypothetical protein
MLASRGMILFFKILQSNPLNSKDIHYHPYCKLENKLLSQTLPVLPFNTFPSFITSVGLLLLFEDKN